MSIPELISQCWRESLRGAYGFRYFRIGDSSRPSLSCISSDETARGRERLRIGFIFSPMTIAETILFAFPAINVACP
jgi:hypothetical protein